MHIAFKFWERHLTTLGDHALDLNAYCIQVSLRRAN
jgi:hypothetical protein